MQAVFPKKRRNIYEFPASPPPSGSLESITVRAKAGCQSGCKDESMCGNYECIK